MGMVMMRLRTLIANEKNQPSAVRLFRPVISYF
jgi:hypothetical protein